MRQISVYTCILVHLVYINLGGMPDKLRIFPADESNKLYRNSCPGITGLSGPTMNSSTYVYYTSLCASVITLLLHAHV